ncbi:hypothetical protein F7731_13150 [Cytobacillus depressus]|uniref:Uncharacterized protein n=1 Tax=Cytobacillus depressus TaxID=1602942 RepID=A0A6L3V3V1_9BACI|nr:hypothetical protein [Cytobacillus depressus]KAB2334716.1 hypothetical protein F7731_13150 [Cytobacillus depressus]
MYYLRGRPNYYRGDERFLGFLFGAPFVGGLLGGLIGGGIAGFGTAALLANRPYPYPYPVPYPVFPPYGYGQYPPGNGFGYPYY